MTARILLVEDDPVSRELIAALLASRGHDVDAVDDGFGALRMAQEKAYDLVFVDYHLPEMDGYALARLMRSLGETSTRPLRMVAITADRFGLAARRGVDSIFDRVLSKPIDPDALFAFVDDFLGREFGGEANVETLDAFLEPAPPEDPRGAGLMLWRARGLAALPTAAVFPTPSIAERASLEHCFRLVESDAPDCLILLRQSGLAAVEAWRSREKAYLQPLFVIDPKLAPIADLQFDVGDAESWSSAATAINDFKTRRSAMKDSVPAPDDIDLRLAAYLYVADRSLDLCRDTSGRTYVPYTAGFPVAGLVESVKRLAARGLVSTKLDQTCPAPERRLVVNLSGAGYALLVQPSGDPRVSRV